MPAVCYAAVHALLLERGRHWTDYAVLVKIVMVSAKGDRVKLMMGVDRTPFYEGIQAYQSGDLERAIDRFRSQLCHAPDEWECRLYLGMAYARIGRMLEAKREFMDIRDMCADESLRKKAAAAFSMLVESSLKKPQAN